MGSLINDLARFVNQALLDRTERKLTPLPQFSPMQLPEPSRSYSVSLAQFPGRRRAVERVIPPYYRRSQKSEYLVTEQEIISKIAQEDSDREKLYGTEASAEPMTSSSDVGMSNGDEELYRQDLESKLWELFEQKSAETLQQITDLGAPYGAHYHGYSANVAEISDVSEASEVSEDAAADGTISDAGWNNYDIGTESFIPMDCPAQFGRISVEKIHDDRNQTGMIRNIGAFLLDPDAVALFEKFIKSGRAPKYMKSLNAEQNLVLTRLQEYLIKQEEVDSTIVIGQDGMILSSRQAEGIDVGTFASWALCAYVNSKTVAQKLTRSNGPKHIVLSSESGAVVISEFGQALLITISSANSASITSSLMDKLGMLLA